jgi:predicted nucleic acid-binding protein
MRDSAAFFDTSAIVPLCLAQSASQQARRIYREFQKHTVAWTCQIEATAGICRAARVLGLAEMSRKRSLERLAELRNRWLETAVSEKMRSLSIDLLQSYDLRAGDAIQLASAIVWCRERPRNRPFVSFDLRLAEIAASIGFAVIV